MAVSMAPAAAFPVPSIMGTEELAVFDGLPIHHVHGTNDWMFDISQVREADGRASEVLAETWNFTEMSDWTHASPAKVMVALIFLSVCSQCQEPEKVWPSGELGGDLAVVRGAALAAGAAGAAGGAANAGAGDLRRGGIGGELSGYTSRCHDRYQD